jgi:sugar phosphate isomerase/epimerase
MENKLTRRRFLTAASAAATAGLGLGRALGESSAPGFEFRFLLGSCLYGFTELAEMLPEVSQTGAAALDIWPLPHGNQREQLDLLGEERFGELLKRHGVSLGCMTQYKLGPFGLRDEMRLAQRLGCHTIVTGGKGPVGLKGDELKRAVSTFIEQLRPHLDVAEATGVTIAIENHGNNLIDSPDSIRWLMELSPSAHLGIAFAPYHLPQDTKRLSQLIRDLGNRIAVFYAWQHGMGCTKKLPKDQELLQMPGRGKLDFTPLLAVLCDIEYHGWTEIFMHPVPRGIPILDSTDAVSDEINRARQYLNSCLEKV